jgi:hypothetical protein
MAFETRELIQLAAVGSAAGLVICYAKEIAEALARFRGGGPRPPTHPLPGNDAVLVLRRRTKLNAISTLE